MDVNPSVITSFNAGELSEKLGGRFDLEITYKGGQVVQNVVPFTQGGFITRPGLKYLGITKTGQKARMIPFAINRANPFVLEFTNNLLRIWKSGELVGSPTEVVTSYETSDIFDVQYVQIGNKMYLVHELNVVAIITYSGGTTFSLDAMTIRVSADFNAWTASTAYIEGDVVTNGTPLKAYTCIGAGTSAASGGPTTEGDDSITDNTVTWIWEWTKPFSQAGDYPSAIGLYNQRLWFAGGTNHPQGIWASLPYWYNWFDFMDIIDTTAINVVDAALWDNPLVPETETVAVQYVNFGEGNALYFEIASTKEDDIMWLLGANTMIIGSSRAEWVTPATINAIDIAAFDRSKFGSARIQPINFQDSPIFAAGSTSKAHLREYAYLAESAVLQSENLNHHADHMLEDGISQMDFRTEPQPEIYCVTDGELAVLVYDKSSGTRAWYHIVTDGGDIESVAIVPGTTDDDVYVSVNRAGGRTVELLDPLWDLDKTPLDSYVEIASIGGATQTGLDRFDGETVTIYNVDDDTVHTAAVTSGSLTYPDGDGVGDHVFIGMAIESLFQTMRLNKMQYEKDNVVACTVRVLNSMPFKVGFANTAASLQTARRSDEVAWTSAYTGDVRVPFQGEWASDAWVWIVQDQPYRSCVLSLVPEVAE